MTAPRDAVHLLRLPMVAAQTGLSRSEIYRRLAAGAFPRPVRLGARACAWVSGEIAAWVAERLAERDAGSAS